MVKYSCEQCGKEFSQKSHYSSHKKRITPCENKEDKTIQVVEDKCKELNNKEMIDGTEVKTYNKMVEGKLQKPFLKWVGGKTQIINNVIEKFPKEMVCHRDTIRRKKQLIRQHSELRIVI